MARDPGEGVSDGASSGVLGVFHGFPSLLLPTPHSAVTFPPESELINVTFSSLFLLWVMHPPPVPALTFLTNTITLTPHAPKDFPPTHSRSLHPHPGMPSAEGVSRGGRPSAPRYPYPHAAFKYLEMRGWGHAQVQRSEVQG